MRYFRAELVSIPKIMDNLEKNIKNRLHNATTQGSVNADDLWDSIDAELGPQSSKRRWLGYSLFIGLLLISTLGVYYFNSESIEKQSTIEDVATIKTQKQVIDITSESNSTIDKTESTNTQAQASITNKIENTNKTLITNTKNTESLTNSTNQQHTTKRVTKDVITNPVAQSDNKNSANITSIPPIANTNPDSNTNANANTKQQISSTVNEANQANTNETSIIVLQELPTSDITLKSPAKSMYVGLLATTQDKARKLSFGFHALANTTSNQFASTGTDIEVTDRLAQLDAAYNKSLGYTLNAEIGYQFHKNISFKTGIDYIRVREEFNAVQTWDTVMWRNNIPNSELIDAKAKRTVKHLNESTIISIPLMLSLHQQTGKWQYGINGGIGLNLAINQQGKSLNANDYIVDIPLTNTPPRPSFSMSYLAQPFVSYHTNTNLSLQLKASIRAQAYEFSEFYGLDYRSMMSGIGVGFSWRL